MIGAGSWLQKQALTLPVLLIAGSDALVEHRVEVLCASQLPNEAMVAACRECRTSARLPFSASDQQANLIK